MHAPPLPVIGLCALVALLLLGGTPPIHAEEERRSVFVSILPQEFLVERIGGERVSVQALVQPGHSPHTYDPSPRQMAALARAEVYFRIGVGFERGVLPKIEAAHPTLLVVDTRRGIPLRTMVAHHHHDDNEDEGTAPPIHPVPATTEADHDEHAHEADTKIRARGEEEKETHAPHGESASHDHEHGKEHAAHDAQADEHHEHDGAGKDPHIWLSPRLLKTQARTIADTLIHLDPDGTNVYERNYAALAHDLDALDTALRNALAPVKGQTLFVFHPAWGYFADAYGLVQTAIETEGKAPTARQLARLIEHAKANHVRVIFVQPQMSQTSAQAIAEAIDGVVLPINPLARDALANLNAVADAIRTSLTPIEGK